MVVIVSGIIAILGWFIFFGLGMFINSQPFRDALAQNLEWKSFFISLITYTPTNIAFLCLAAAFCGGCSSNLGISKIKETEDDENKKGGTPQNFIVQQNPFNCMIRGFVVYIAFLGGMYVVANAPFASPSPEQYARAAGIVSLLAYVVGYDQSNFFNLINLNAKLKKET